MKTFIITDTHFNHKNIIKYCGRPENFDDLIWQSLESLPSDCVLIHLGDICIGDDLMVHEMLSCYPFRKILVKGNHDGKSNSWYLNHGWDFVCESFTDIFYGEKITFSHRPMKGVSNINIHGHFHDSKHRNSESEHFYDPNFHKLLAIEYTNYQPIELQKFLSKK